MGRRRVLLLQLDGKTPNLALMRLSAWHRQQGHAIEFRKAGNSRAVEVGMFDAPWHRVYASLIFERTRLVARRLLEIYPNAVVGGSGWTDDRLTVEAVGVPADTRPDYTIYPDYQHSIGFTQRGCRLKCPFCSVPRREGENRPASTVGDIYRGEPWPRNLLLLDNDFFGQADWRRRIEEMNVGRFRVSFNQGFNVRLIGEEEAAAIASTNYYDNQFKTRRLYTAWDNRKDGERLFRNLESLTRHGVKPDNILVYMLVGYWDGPRLTPDDFYRHTRLREFGCRPYPMPYARNRELVGFQRWVIGAYDKRVAWSDWERAGYEPRRLGVAGPNLFAGVN